MSLTVKEFANGTFNLSYLNFRLCRSNRSASHDKYLSIHPRSYTIATSQYVGDTCQANEKGQGHVRPISSGVQFFTPTINTPASSSLRFYYARSHSRSSSANPSAAATSLSLVRKSLTASTSSLPYSRRPRKSSLRRRRSCLPLPS